MSVAAPSADGPSGFLQLISSYVILMFIIHGYITQLILFPKLKAYAAAQTTYE